MARKQVIYVTEKKKKGCGYYIFILLLIIIIAGVLGGNSDSDSQAPQPTATDKVSTTQTGNVASALTAMPTATSTAKPTQTPATKAEVKSMLEANLSDAYSYSKVDITDTGFNIMISTENIGQAAYYASLSQDEAILKEWNTMCAGLVNKCLEYKEFVESQGLKNQLVMLTLVNDENTDLALVSIINGAIVHNEVVKK